MKYNEIKTKNKDEIIDLLKNLKKESYNLRFQKKNGQLDKDCINILREIPEIVELHVTTGNYTLLAKIICKDTKHLYRVLSEKVQAIEDVQKSETFISMEEIVNRPISVMA